MSVPPPGLDTSQPPPPPFLVSCQLKRGRQEVGEVGEGEDLPTVVEELANMVAVSGEELEDIARNRNELTPELRFLQEKGSLYRKYRERVNQIKMSLDGNSEEPKRKRRSRWGDKEPVISAPAPAPALAGVRRPSPALLAYAQRVLGTTELSEEQWRQCEDQLKVNSDKFVTSD